MRSPSARPPGGRLAAVLTWGAIAVVALGGCSDDETPPAGPPATPPTDAAVADFCAVASPERQAELDEASAAEDWTRMSRLIDATGAGWRATGTPADIPAAARDGLLLTLAAIDRLGPDELRAAAREHSDPFRAGLSEAEEANVRAFDTYLRQTCSGGVAERP